MKILFKAMFAFYFSILFYIFFLARRRPHPTFLRHSGGLIIMPFKNKITQISNYEAMDPMSRWLLFTDFFGNIALFVPLPFFLAIVFNVKSYGKMILIACASSICVECTQFIFSIGVADIDDVILNTLGAVIGVLIVRILKKIMPSFFFTTI